jgi:hypothetical protein
MTRWHAGPALMRQLTPGLRLSPATAPADECDPEELRPSAGVGASGLPQRDMRLQPLPLRQQKPLVVMRVARTPQSRERLGRLRRELGRIQPPPADQHEARLAILNALARAGLGDWTVPELSAPSTSRGNDGSAVLRLLAHIVVINPSGAFRIVDTHSPQFPYFELQAANGSAFAMPGGL